MKSIVLVLLLLCAYSKFLGQTSLLDSDDILYVHLFPHSHDDVGWVRTVKEYYEMNKGVRQIITSYMGSLMKDPTKKFIQVEVAFFKMWWNEQNSTMQSNVTQLIANGQLEFINGGWCMNDEATPYYEDIIDQMTVGHKYLLDNFNVIPHIGWQVDPFGHSSTQALFSHLMGFDGWFMGRIDEEDKQLRSKQKALEMIMHPTTQHGGDYPVFTHVNYYGFYSSPQGFDFDVNAPHQQITNQSLAGKADQFVKYFNKQRQEYRGNIIGHTLGMDFEWSDAPSYYGNIDKLIEYVNNNKKEFKMQIEYSTPWQYVKAINQRNVSYPIKQDDFFPYADNAHSYWTGYFTSRVAFKGYIKQSGRYAQIIKRFIGQLTMNKNRYIIDNPPDNVLLQLYESLGTCQHHDAVTGTAKQAVTNDYIDTLYHSIVEMDKYMAQLLSYTVKQEIFEQDYTFIHCNYNMTSTECKGLSEPLLSGKTVLLTLIDNKINNDGNSEIVHIRIPKITVTIIDQSNRIIHGDIICRNPLDENDCDLYFNRQVDNTKLITYYKLYMDNTEQKSTTIITAQELSIHDNSAITLKNGKSFKISYGFYHSFQGGGQASGAYIFRPDSSETKSQPYGQVVSSKQYVGKLVDMIYIQYTHCDCWITAYVQNEYHIETYIHSINTDDYRGKEIVLLIDTGILSGNTFYTDSNGLELQERILNYRPTWKLTVNEPVSANYYPVNGVFLQQDPNSKDCAALLNDRAQGGTSLKEGQIELMIQRRITRDDARGVGEPLNEQQQGRLGLTQYIKHTLVFFNRRVHPNKHRQLQYLQDLTPLQYYSVSDTKEISPQEPITHTVLNSFINKLESDNLVKLYMQPWNFGEILIRVHNMREVGDITLEFPKSIQFTETTLTGNQEWDTWQQNRLHWNEDTNIIKEQFQQQYHIVGPLQIRTFIISGI